MANCVIAEVFCDSDEYTPIIVDFQNGQLDESKVRKLHPTLLRNILSKRKILAVQNDDMLYTGDVHIDSEDDDERTLLCIRNKKTNKVRMIQVAHATLKANVVKNRDVLDSSFTESKTTSLQLNKEFGSKKKKRFTEQMERMKINIDVVKDDLMNTVSTVTVDDSELKQEDGKAFQYLPTINREATVPAEVYDINDFLLDVELDCLTEEAQKMLAEDAELTVSSFIEEQILNLRKLELTELTLTRCKLLIYVDTILKFFKINSKETSKKSFQPCSFSNEIGNKIFKEFTVMSDKGRTRPISMRDKALCQMLVLLVMACNNRLDLNGISREMKVGVTKLMDLSRMLGFSQKGSEKNVITIKLPLPAVRQLQNKKLKPKRK